MSEEKNQDGVEGKRRYGSLDWRYLLEWEIEANIFVI
jgi:hypothetical protein